MTRCSCQEDTSRHRRRHREPSTRVHAAPSSHRRRHQTPTSSTDSRLSTRTDDLDTAPATSHRASIQALADTSRAAAIRICSV